MSQDNKDRKTCQVCGRKIMAKGGLIAHHGYKRPGDGYQTSSCDGAQYAPYEVSCDRLKQVIGWQERSVEEKQKRLDDFLSSPPETLVVREHRSAWAPDEEKTYQRPENFDPNRYHGIPRTYGDVYARRLYEYQTDGRWAKMFLEDMKSRLAAWVAPENTEVKA